MNSAKQNLDRHPVAEQTSIDEQVPVIDILDLVNDSSSSAASFRGKRTDGDYADYGIEVQISQFRK